MAKLASATAEFLVGPHYHGEGPTLHLHHSILKYVNVPVAHEMNYCTLKLLVSPIHVSCQ